MTDPPVVHMIDLSHVYPGTPPVVALRPTNLLIPRGQYASVVGPSGSGKSTLLNLLGLLDRPSSGSYLLDGFDVARLRERDRAALRGRRIGFVFQAFHLLPYRTAMENVALAQIYSGIPARRRRENAWRTLTEVGLGHRKHALAGTLSGGERQRVAIARALVNSPSLLLCDEPTGNLDSASAASVMELLSEVHANGYSVIVITHDPNVAARGERIITIRDGHVIG